MDAWTTPELLKRFRWRLALYKAGWAWFWLSVCVGLYVAVFEDFDQGLKVMTGLMILSVLPMVPASRCLHCGAYNRNASLRNGFDCAECGAIHHDPGRRYLKDKGAPPKHMPLPDGLEACWLHPPMPVRYAKRKRIAQAGLALGGFALLLGGLWLVQMKYGWSPLPAAAGAHALGVLAAISLAAGLALAFADSRCPHCRTPLKPQGRLATWCGWCGAVLVLNPNARRAFLARGTLVASAPQWQPPEPVEDLVAEADRAMDAGRSDEAYAIIARARWRYPTSTLLDDWIDRQMDRMTRLL
ncbi:MAG: hypothetical protein JNK75_05450 [Betaproteobacteria bacterium]|nr:hypothetical protein [Betaproteobacteria bacterium]